jgi:Bacterial Ig domain
MRPVSILLGFLSVLPASAAINLPLTVQETLYSGSVAGMARTDEPLTVGVPLPDSAGIASTSVLGLTGASAGQFMIEGKWPSGNIKWVKVRAVLPNVPAGGTATVTLTSTGAGNFGGANLAADNGSTITVATGTATFTIKKANFNVLDMVDVGTTHVVLTGTSAGLVLLGPDPTKTYPATVTCSTDGADHPGVSSVCSTVYQSSNDASSTCSIEENGPVMAVLKCDGSLIDGAANTYMKHTTRLHFYQNKNYMKPVVILRNAEYGTSSTFATAYKGYQGFEIRLTANLSGTLTYTFGNDTGTPTTGTMSGSNTAYLYVAETAALKGGQSATSWCVGYGGCVLPSSLTGYVIMNNGSAVVTGTASQFPQGWADIQDSGGVGIQIGQYQLASYGNKSLEFRGGGTDVRIGLWAAENNSTSLASTTANTAYYIPWPEHDIQEAWINFHVSAPASMPNEFLKYQHYLVARASIAHYNSTNVFLYPLLDPTEEDTYYTAMVSAASPSVPSFTAHDQGTNTYPWYLKLWRYYGWPSGGGANQMEFRLSYLLNFLRRGYTGQYLEAASFYKMQAERSFPQSDGFDWRNKPASETQNMNFPTATRANVAKGMDNWIEIGLEHDHGYGMMDYYFLSGDEAIKDVLTDSVVDWLLDTNSTNNLITDGKVWNARAAGVVMMWSARMYDFMLSMGDSTTANSILARGNTTWTTQVKSDLCVSGYPSGCTPDPVGGNNLGAFQRGVSFVRGIPFQYSQGIFQGGGCSALDRAAAPFQASILLQGMWEYRKTRGSGWADYNSMFDVAYGISQWALNEGYGDNGSPTSWSGNGFRYYIAMDLADACDTDNYPPSARETVYYPFYITQQYTGTSAWKRQFKQVLQRNQSVQNIDENYHYTIANAIYQDLHPDITATLNTLPLTNFVDNGGGGYTISWTVPTGAQSYRIKWGAKQIVDWIGFDAGNNTFIGDPAATMNWFAANEASSVPAPSGSTQSLTINTGKTGLTAVNFMVKAYVGGGSPSPGDTTPPVISVTVPANGSTLSGTTSLSASAFDNIGVTGVQFRLDGSNLGAVQTGGGPSYLLAWDTKTVSNGVHLLSAAASDAAGNTGISSSVSVTVSNSSSDFTIGSTASSQGAVAGTSAQFALNVSALNGFAAAVALSVSGLPAGVTAAFSPPTITASGTSTLTLSIATSTAAGIYPMTVTAVSGALSHTASITLTVIATPPSGGGTAVPLNSWSPIVARGVPAQIYGYDKSVYVDSRKTHCIWGGYHQTLSSELQEATVCYSYSENRWFVLQNNGMWHSDHLPPAGHTSSMWAYMPDRDTIVSMTDGSGSNAPEKFLGHWWWFDVAGLTGQDKEFAPRPWLGVTTPTSALGYDATNSKLVIFPDAWGVVEVCDPGTNSCVTPQTSGTPPPSMGNLSLVYNSNDHKMYVFGGGQSAVYTYDVATRIWTKLVTTCTGTDCVSGSPPARQAGGAAYSSLDNVFLIAGGVGPGGLGTGTAYTDTWIFDPVGAAWREQSPLATYANNSTNATFDRVSYDRDSNVFVLMSSGGNGNYADGAYGSYTVQVWGYAYSPAQNYGRVSKTYTPPAGALNRVSQASGQSWAFDAAIAVSGSMLYAGWIETGSPFDSSNCGMHHPYVQSSADLNTWTGLPGGSQAAACAAIDPEPSGNPANTDGSKLKVGVVNGTLWEAHEKWNNSTIPSSAWARSWNGTAWTGGQVGCFSGTCSNVLFQYPQALVASGTTPTLAVIEENHTVFTTEGYVFVAQPNGSSWAPLGGKLNIAGAGSRALSATIASDGTNPAACWSEEVDTTRSAVATTPQIQCAQWTGAGWTRFGSSSLNQSGSSWANSPSMTYVGGKYYISWVERTTSGVNKVYACRWDGSSCTLLGGGALNVNAVTGWAAHPSLSNDGTNVFLAWEEQALGDHSIGFVKKWDGSSWSRLGGALNADAINGSVEGITLTVFRGLPTAIWGELSFGNLRQMYVKQWNGTIWVGASGGSPVPMSCDLNGDGQINGTDIGLARDQALGIIPCTTADLQQNGTCSVVGVQRVINASLGGPCRIGN